MDSINEDSENNEDVLNFDKHFQWQANPKLDDPRLCGQKISEFNSRLITRRRNPFKSQ